jgi:hypothetical protein
MFCAGDETEFSQLPNAQKKCDRSGPGSNPGPNSFLDNLPICLPADSLGKPRLLLLCVDFCPFFNTCSPKYSNSLIFKWIYIEVGKVALSNHLSRLATCFTLAFWREQALGPS